MTETETLQSVRAEIVAITGDPALTTDQIGDRLGQIYNQAEQTGDNQSMALVQTAWDQVQALNVTAHAAIDTAVAARLGLELAALIARIRGEEVPIDRSYVEDEYDEL